MKKSTILTVLGVFVAILSIYYCKPVRAQSVPPATATTGQGAPTPAPVTAPPAAQTPAAAPTSYAHHYLSQHVQLTEENKEFYATRTQLGCSFPPGISDNTVTTGVRFDVDQSTLTKFLTTLKSRVDSGSAPAHPVLATPFVHETKMLFDNVARPAVIVPASPATSLVIADSAASISSALTTTPNTPSIGLVIKTGALPGGGAGLVGIDSRLSHFVTHFDTGEVGRTVTVRRAIQLIDGTVLQPGQIFSINQTVGERTAARGFGIGKVFINGAMQNQVGGGMCQVATTLFNAALLANLKIVERHQHVRTVPYVPAGGDATVYYGEKDFKFQNNTTAPVYIYYKTYGRFAVADLYGKGNPSVKVTVQTIPTKLGERYYKGVIRRYVTANGKTVNDYTAYSSYQWTPALDYQR